MCYGDGWKGQRKPRLGSAGWWVPVPAHVQEVTMRCWWVAVLELVGPAVSARVLSVPPQLCFCSMAALHLSSLFPAPSALPFAGCDSPWRVPILTSPAHSMCNVPWTRAEPQLTAAFPNPDAVPVASGWFFGEGGWGAASQ